MCGQAATPDWKQKAKYKGMTGGVPKTPSQCIYTAEFEPQYPHHEIWVENLTRNRVVRGP